MLIVQPAGRGHAWYCKLWQWRYVKSVGCAVVVYGGELPGGYLVVEVSRRVGVLVGVGLVHVGVHVCRGQDAYGDRTIAVSSGGRGQWIVFARVQLCARLGRRQCRRC
eukprot:IDg21936t1